jgi:hypothetical protein
MFRATLVPSMFVAAIVVSALAGPAGAAIVMPESRLLIPLRKPPVIIVPDTSKPSPNVLPDFKPLPHDHLRLANG